MNQWDGAQIAHEEWLRSIGVNPDRTPSLHPCDICHGMVDTVASTVIEGEWVFACLQCCRNFREGLLV